MSITPQELREISDSGKMFFGYFPRSGYNSNVTTEQFTELTYNGKPVFLGWSGCNKTIASIRFDTQNNIFTNFTTISLINSLLTEATSTTEYRETRWYNKLVEQGFDFRNYIWRLWYTDGLETYEEYTGIIEEIEPNFETVKIKLNSRASELAKKEECVDSHNTFAGWSTNTRFETALEALTRETDVEYTGDITGIDYIDTVNEGELDLIGFDKMGHVSYYEENVVFICRGRDSIKYNFINNTRTPFDYEHYIHFHFIHDSEHYFVVSKTTDSLYVAGEYRKLYIVKESDLSEIYLGVGKAPEYTANYAPQATFIDAVEGKYCARSSETIESFGVNSSGTNYAHFVVEDTATNTYDILSEVIEITEYQHPKYYAPTTNYRSYIVETGTRQSIRWEYTQDGLIDTGQLPFLSCNVNSLSYDEFKFYEANTGRLQYNKKRAGSQKARSYFAFDSVNNRLYFQRASTLSPSGSSETIDTDFTKTWDNFGLNPLGYYSFNSDTLNYSHLTNNYFIDDWIVVGSKIYAIVHTFSQAAKYKDENRFVKFVEITSTGITDISPELNVKDAYGISIFTLGSVEYYSFVYRNNDNTWYLWYKTNTGASAQITLGTNVNYEAGNSIIVVNNVAGLLIFRDQKLNRVEFDFNTNTISNKVEYIGTILDDSYGAYSVQNQSTEDYTSLFFNNLVTASTVPKFDVLDGSDLTAMQALISITKAADKFAFIDSNDVLNFKDVGNIPDNGWVIDEVTNLKIEDYEGYKTLNINAYAFKPEDLFNWNIVKGADWVGDLRGRWYGADASFVLNVDIIDTTQGSGELVYNIVSSSENLTRSDTTIDNITDWTDITIHIADSFLTLQFFNVNGNIETPPNEGNVFACNFNSRKLEKQSSPVFKSTSNNLNKGKKIDNRYLDYNKASFLQDAIEEWFLPIAGVKKRIFKIDTTDAYASFDFLQYIYINVPSQGVEMVKCLIMSAKINKDNSTNLQLIEV